MQIMEIKYGLDDVSIVPAEIGYLNSRNEVIENFRERIWVSPMDSILGIDNLKTFKNEGLKVPLVRGMWKNIEPNNFDTALFATFSLSEIKNIIDNTGDVSNWFEGVYSRYNRINILIDIANGHLYEVLQSCIILKDMYNVTIMMGNIANPNFLNHIKIDGKEVIDYIRVGIGGGSRCHTSSKTAIHYPMISLLQELKNIRYEQNLNVKLIADGGIRNSSDIAKCFAAGADGVMLGSMFAKTMESSNVKHIKDSPFKLKDLASLNVDYYLHKKRIYGSYRGMSTIERQKTEGKKDANYEEGFSEDVLIEYYLSDLINEITKSLRSTFSYCNSDTLARFRSQSELIITLSKNHNTL